MTIEEQIEQIHIEDCPTCGGGGYLDEECGSVFTVNCLDCGSHTVTVDIKNGDKLAAAQRAADLWNMGKVITCSLGE